MSSLFEGRWNYEWHKICGLVFNILYDIICHFFGKSDRPLSYPVRRGLKRSLLISKEWFCLFQVIRTWKQSWDWIECGFRHFRSIYPKFARIITFLEEQNWQDSKSFRAWIRAARCPSTKVSICIDGWICDGRSRGWGLAVGATGIGEGGRAP